ncbi:MAG TPA: hypothetical protein ENK43_16765 [Planctomycetes bacterium]|nr:hypothetical protein [Planctomycetota bacterium]
MTEDGLFLLLLVGLYFWECLNWLTPGSMVFRGTMAGRARWSVPDLAFENRLGVPVLGRPWPPFVALFGFAPWPLAVTADGVATHTATSWIRDDRPRRPLKWWRWEDIEEVDMSGRDLLIDGERVVRIASPRMLRRIHDLLVDLLDLDPPTRRERIQEELDDWLDAEVPRSRLELGLGARRGVWLFSQVLFAHIVVISPFVVITQGLAGTWIPLAGVALVLNILVTVFYVVAHRIQQPEEVGERWTTALVMALFIPLTARAHDHLTRDLLGDVHPWAASHLLDAEERETLGSWLARDLRWPLPEFEDLPDDAIRILAGFHTALEGRLGPLLPTLAPSDAEGRNTCPRCEEVFSTPPVVCPDCGVLLDRASS